MIPESKLRALREALEEKHWVRFHNGSQVEYEDCERCEGTGEVLTRPPLGSEPIREVPKKTCPTCGGEKVRLLVTRAAGGASRYRLDVELARAYAMALDGPKPKPQPAGDGSKFGEEVPF